MTIYIVMCWSDIYFNVLAQLTILPTFEMFQKVCITNILKLS